MTRLRRGLQTQQVRQGIAILALLIALAGVTERLGGAAAAGTGGRPPHDVIFGFNDDWLKYRAGLDYPQGAGAEALRFPVSWREVQRKPGRWRWRNYDQLYDAATERGLGLIFTPQDSPCWAHPSVKCRRFGGTRPDRAYLDEFGRFVRRALRRYPNILAVEVWNEPNLAPYYLPGPDPVEYARILRSLYATVKAKRPHLPVLFGGTAPIGNTVAGRRMDYMRFVRTANNHGAAHSYDGISVHSFEDLEGTKWMLERMQREQARIGHPNRGLWLTEIGYSESESGGEAEQAALLIDTYQRLRRLPLVASIIFHRMFDIEADTRHADMGIVSADGTRKLAYCAFAEARGLTCEPEPED